MIPIEKVKNIPINDVAYRLGLSFRSVGSVYQSEECPSGHVSKNGTCFSLNPEKNLFHCFSCGISGGSIKLVMIVFGLSFVDALKWIAEQFCISDVALSDNYRNYKSEKRAAKQIIKQAWTPKAPEFKLANLEVWQKKALSFLCYCQNELQSSSEQMNWLQIERCLSDSTVKRFGLGYNPQDWYIKPSDFGIDGKKIYLPKGIVLPFFVDDKVVRLRIRKDEIKDSNDSRYHTVRGSDMRPYVIDNGKSLWMIVESELDGILIAQEAGALLNVCALGSAQTKPDKELHEKLTKADSILVSLDDDDSGEKAAWEFWQKTYFRVKLWIPDGGKDQTEMMKAGHDLRLWTEAGLMSNAKTL